MTGKFQQTSFENEKEFMSEVGVNFFLSPAASPVMEVREDDGAWLIRFSTKLTTYETEFMIGEDVTTPCLTAGT